jgi:hypothetical protein
MATETVQPVTHEDMHSQLVTAESRTKKAENVHEQEKSYVASVASGSEHPLDPKEVAEDPNEKHLALPTPKLQLDDFELMRTLGTGT